MTTLRQYKRKEVKAIGGAGELKRRLKAWQTANHCSGLTSAHSLGLECVGYCAGVYGCSGGVYRDLETGKLYGGTDNPWMYVR